MIIFSFQKDNWLQCEEYLRVVGRKCSQNIALVQAGDEDTLDQGRNARDGNKWRVTDIKRKNQYEFGD